MVGSSGGLIDNKQDDPMFTLRTKKREKPLSLSLGCYRYSVVGEEPIFRRWSLRGTGPRHSEDRLRGRAWLPRQRCWQLPCKT